MTPPTRRRLSTPRSSTRATTNDGCSGRRPHRASAADSQSARPRVLSRGMGGRCGRRARPRPPHRPAPPAGEASTQSRRTGASRRTSTGCLPTRSVSGTSTWTSRSGPRLISRTSASGWPPRSRPPRRAGKAELAREVVAGTRRSRAGDPSSGRDRSRGGFARTASPTGFCSSSAACAETLARNGIEAVDPKGEKFDPNQHEALSTLPVEGTEPGPWSRCMQKGYRLGDQLIRPARVVVSE